MSLLADLRTKFQAWLKPRSLGQRGEDAAAKFLRKLGYIIVARGHRDRIGEIDLIAVEGRTVVFVEVKTRSSQDAGHPAEAVDDDKQRISLGLKQLIPDSRPVEAPKAADQRDEDLREYEERSTAESAEGFGSLADKLKGALTPREE